nr:MAG TPA: hypothetical protein [Bacteriophage sp.]
MLYTQYADLTKIRANFGASIVQYVYSKHIPIYGIIF